jgi:vacuolar-type H+-ATPase subunit H
MQHGDHKEPGIQQHLGAIKDVQITEEEAARMVEGAKADKDKAISDARKKAEEMIEKAKANAKERRQKEIDDAFKALEKEKAETLREAERKAREIRDKKLSGAGRERLLKELTSLILGA